MKKTFTLILIGFASVFFMADGYAQTVVIDADFRARFENRHGYKTIFPKDAEAANFISQRSRLKLFYGAEKFKVGFSLQNVGIWGENSQLTKANFNGTMVHEAWGEILFSEKFSLKAGRQEIIYDDHRIFGSVDWTMQGRSHDAAIFKLKPNDKHKVDVGLAYNSNPDIEKFGTKQDYTVGNSYKSFQYVHWHGDFDALGISFLFLNNGKQYINSEDTTDIKEKISYSQTFGPRFTYKKDKLKANAAFYMQMGNNTDIGGDMNGNDTTMEISAMYFEIDASYAINDNFSIGAGVEYLSGNDGKEIADNKGVQKQQKAFAPLYGTNHKFNGWMDYFYVGGGAQNHWGTYGLMDIFIPLKYKKDKFSAALIPHIFSTAGTIYAPKKDENFEDLPEMMEYSKGLGTEIDIVLGYTVTKGVAIKAGYSMMFASETMEVLKSTQVDKGNTWGWVMLVFKPTFYQSK